MAYVQKNNPFPVTSCGRRRTFTQGGVPGDDRHKESRFKNGPAKKTCNCWKGHSRVPGTEPCAPGSCEKDSPAKRTKPHTGGMSASERKAYNSKTGGNVKAPQPGGGSRKDSYCARSAGIKKCKDPDKNGDCPNDIARRNWKC